ncbi:ubiquitin-conjugating enzyme e2 s-like [Lichtheimia corymbifera JMRC:FSU:9682]|uniref:E2 ubiquitin-conjugating enzyme n=1 Tax=Lichtheimia corymbifera JMRC:FSU:9682 TaxID=1263082 RepID=A0A068RYJ8_9FUNG|nr:ubiquitin-conjugating enzyme e2 s-like [Lichtheimia corymbifera JMRC:FSU:9682]
MGTLAPQALKSIAKELQSLERSPPEDVQVIQGEQDLTEIQAWIRGPDGTPYENGYFKVRLLLADGYPEVPPKGYFVTKIFHPNVAPNGEICVNTLKKDWKSTLGIAHVLLTVKCLLIVPNPESALNEEAGKLLLEQYDDYAKRARLYTTIHAKSGRQEFNALAAERAPVDKQNENTSKDTTATTTNTTSTAPATKKEDSTSASATTTSTNTTTTTNITTTKSNAGAGNVLTSAASNIATQTAGVKRSAGELQGGKDNTILNNKQSRTETAQTKRKPMAVADRKKQLRRL